MLNCIGLFPGPFQPSNELLLRFYAYYKQATEGTCGQPKPAFWDVVGRAKWDAWRKLGNMPRQEAMGHYIEEIEQVSCSSFLKMILRGYMLQFYCR